MRARHLMIWALAAAGLLLSATGGALDLSKGYPSEAAEMDGNRDGMVSKEEYLRYHAEKFEQMQNGNGLVAVEDMIRYLRGPGGESR